MKTRKRYGSTSNDLDFYLPLVLIGFSLKLLVFALLSVQVGVKVCLIRTERN